MKNHQHNLKACVICNGERGKMWAKLLSHKFHQIFLVTSPKIYREILPINFETENYSNYSGELLRQLPPLIDVAFVHESDEVILSGIETKFKYIFKFTTSGYPHVQEEELPIYRKNDIENNDLGVKEKDIEEVVAYITQERGQLPSMCFPIISLDTNQELKNLSHRQNFFKEVEELFKSYNTDFYQSIYRFLGYPRPIVYVFDDYNNYITYENSFYNLKTNISSNVAKYYCGDQGDFINKFQEALKGFCLMLNNLSLAFTVKAPPLPISISEEQANHELICSILPIDSFEQERSQIIGFILDLEWLPHLPDNNLEQYSPQIDRQQWKKMGCYAIDILSQRYPEIPTFIFTGLQPSEEVQEALSHGAYWGFKKEKTHHYSSPEITNHKLPDQLNYINFEHHLTRAVNVRYGAYKAVPFPEQLKLDDSTAPRRKLLEKLKVDRNKEQSNQEKILRKLVAGLLPTADLVEPVKVITTGKSQAQATFFVSPIYQQSQLATRFIKIGPWFLIQKEYLAYQKVIQPRLNSYTANIIQKPILTEGEPGQMPWGALMYSLAGFPEDYNNLKSLHELCEQYMEHPNGDVILGEKIKNTLEKVLFPLYQSSLARAKKAKPKTLGYWLGDILPPLYTGVLIPLPLTPIQILEQVEDAITLLSTNPETENLTPLTFPDLNDQLKNQRRECEQAGLEEISHLDNDILTKPFKQILLSGWKLSALEWENSSSGNGSASIILIHPHLGIRILLRGQSEDIRLRFGATWLRPDMSVKVAVCFDCKNKEFEKIRQKVKESITYFGFSSDAANTLDVNDFNELIKIFQEQNNLHTQSFLSPFDVFNSSPDLYKDYPDSFMEGCRHGDLNLNNILYAANDTVGWLIDFERVKEQGTIAFDLAKLEVEIWNHHIFPYIAALADLEPSHKKGYICCQLLCFCLQASDFPGNEFEFLITKIASTKLFQLNSSKLLTPITNGLKIIKEIRYFGLHKCHLTLKELRWSLSAYFFNASKFSCQHEKYKQYITKTYIFPFLGSVWYLNSALSTTKWK